MTTTAKPRKRPATYADLEAVPSNLVAEILGGELVTHPRPRPRHGIASAALGVELGGPFQKGGGGGPGGWIFIVEPELHLGENIVVPDLAAWRRERLPTMPEEVGITIAPDWACEVLSPSTAIHDRTIKFDIYHDFGVGHLWYLDPEYKTLEVFGRGAEHWQTLKTFGGHDDVRAEPFDAISFSLGALWPYDPPPAVEGG
jgi:Uma2 family endonuclease